MTSMYDDEADRHDRIADRKAKETMASNIDGTVMGNCGAGDPWRVPVDTSVWPVGTTDGCVNPDNPYIPNYYQQYQYPYYPQYVYQCPSTSSNITITYADSVKWREEVCNAPGPRFAIDLPGVPAEELRVEIQDNRYIVAHFRRADEPRLAFERTEKYDLQGRDIDFDSAKATFKHCVLRVEFRPGSKNVKRLDIAI
jgi:hypothetical protein